MRILWIFLLSACFSPASAAPPGDFEEWEDVNKISISTPLDKLDYQTAIQFWMNNPHTGTKFNEQAERGFNQDILAKYGVLIDNQAYDPNLNIAPANIQQLGFIDFTVAENSTQGWARMSDKAVPALTVTVNGEGTAYGTASWRTNYIVPGYGTRNVSLKFRIPEAVLDGRFEFSGKGPYRGRIKAQVLVNGYPVWWSEAMRIAPANAKNGTQYVIDTLGAPWAFNHATEVAAGKWVTANLGHYSQGTSMQVTVMYFVEADVDEECGYAADMFACMGMTVSFKREETSDYPVFKSSPPSLVYIP